MGVVSKLALAALLTAAMAQTGLAADSTVPSGPVPPPPGSAAPPPPPGDPATTPPTGAPDLLKETPIGDWTLRLYKLPGPDARLCVVSRKFPSGEQLGLIIAALGNGFIYGSDKLTVKDGEQPDIFFSVDRRPVIDMPAAAYDRNSITSLPLSRPNGDKLIDIFARGQVVALGSDKLGIKSNELPLTGAREAVNALRGCARDQGVQTYAVGAGGSTAELIVPPTAPPPPTPSPAQATPGQATPNPATPDQSPPAQQRPVVQDIAPEAEMAIKEAVLAEAKKHKASVGVAVTMPKDVTGDNIADAIIIFTLLEGNQRQGYALVLKTIGKNKFKTLNAIALGGAVADDPPIFTDNGFSVMVTAPDKTTPHQVTVIVAKDKLTIK